MSISLSVGGDNNVGGNQEIADRTKQAGNDLTDTTTITVSFSQFSKQVFELAEKDNITIDDETKARIDSMQQALSEKDNDKWQKGWSWMFEFSTKIAQSVLGRVIFSAMQGG